MSYNIIDISHALYSSTKLFLILVLKKKYSHNNDNFFSYHFLETTKLEAIKHDIEELCSHELLKDANIEIHRQLQESVMLCDSAKKMLINEYQELEAKYEELMKEKKELSAQLESLKQTELHK